MLLLLLAIWTVGCGPRSRGSAGEPEELATVQVAIEWAGVEVTRLRVALQRDGETTATEWDLTDPGLADGCHDLELELLPGGWTLTAEAYGPGDELVASGEAAFDVTAGEETTVELVLHVPAAEPGSVHVTVCLCPDGVVEAVAWSLEATDPPGLHIVATLVEGATPSTVVALVRWDTEEVEVALAPQAPGSRVYQGTFAVVDPAAAHEVEVLAEGMPGCGATTEPEPTPEVEVDAACDTGLDGVCWTGPGASAGDDVICSQTVLPGDEICDGLDNDCNGWTDDEREVVLFLGATFLARHSGLGQSTTRQGPSPTTHWNDS